MQSMFRSGWALDPEWRLKLVRNGTNGVSTNGVTANFMLFLTEGLFGHPVNLLLSPQKCQGIPLFPQSVKVRYLCSGPISVDPICPQPSAASTAAA